MRSPNDTEENSPDMNTTYTCNCFCICLKTVQRDENNVLWFSSINYIGENVRKLSVEIVGASTFYIDGRAHTHKYAHCAYTSIIRRGCYWCRTQYFALAHTSSFKICAFQSMHITKIIQIKSSNKRRLAAGNSNSNGNRQCARKAPCQVKRKRTRKKLFEIERRAYNQSKLVRYKLCFIYQYVSLQNVCVQKPNSQSNEKKLFTCIFFMEFSSAWIDLDKIAN